MDISLPEIPSLDQLKSDFSRVMGQKDALLKDASRLKITISDLDEEEKMLGRVADLFRALIDKAVEEGLEAIETIQTDGLQRVFDDLDLSLKAEMEIRRGKVHVNLVTCDKKPDGFVIEGKSFDSFGGSVIAVESILMRVTVIIRRGLRPMLLLDESLGALDDNYVTNIGRLLRSLSETLGLDILAITHNPQLVESAHRAYRAHRGSAGQVVFKAVE